MDTASRFINKILQNRPTYSFKGASGSKEKISSKLKKKKKKSKLPLSARLYQSADDLTIDSTMEGENKTEENTEKDKPAVMEDIPENPTVIDGGHDDDDVDIGSTENMTPERRNELFQKGVQLEKENKRNAALKCYMGCLQGLQHNTKFPLLPVCLRNIADIFYGREEYDKAIHFVQAEKVYYESALIDTEDIQKKIEDVQKTKNLPSEVNEDTIKAEEFEELARALLDKKQPRMALEYAGKATKIRQQVLGDNHEVTKRSLDFFAAVYAEAGAEQYQDNMKKFGSQVSVDDSMISTDGESTPKPILRNRKPNSDDRAVKKQVSFDEAAIQAFENQEKEERWAKLILWFLFIICFLLLLFLGTYLYCHMTRTMTCSSFKAYVEEIQVKLKYYWYKYSSTPSSKYV